LDFSALKVGRSNIPGPGHGRGLEIELAALGQIGLAPVQIGRLEEAGVPSQAVG